MSASMACAGSMPSERLVHKLDTFTDQNRAAQSTVRAKSGSCTLISRPTGALRANSTRLPWRAEFDRIFTGKTGFVTLDRLLARLNANKPELFKVLDRPEIPLHTNGPRTTSAATSPDARSQAAPAAISGATVATPSSPSSRPAPSSESLLGLSRRTARNPGQRRHSAPARTDPRPRPPALTTTTFAPVTK